MKKINEEEIIALAHKEFPDTDWDNLPDIETCPDVYTVKGRRSTGYFSINKEFRTLEEAESQLEICKSWEGVFLDSLEISKHKSEEDVLKDLYKDVISDHKKPMLAVYADDKLSPEAAQQLVDMSEDGSPGAVGEDLPKVDKEHLGFDSV